MDQKVADTQVSTRSGGYGIALIHLVVCVSLQTAEVVQFILVKDQKKLPIRRAGTLAQRYTEDVHHHCSLLYSVSDAFSCSDLIKHVVKEYRNIYPEIIKRVVRTFDQVSAVRREADTTPKIETFTLNVCVSFQVFGLKLVEIDPKNHMYLLINRLEAVEGAPPIR